ncbi:copia-like retrotransposon [Tanacetum coccineum]|uniref:Copia-like retrotransposon n=1 Tax=Tanacetum coccineum TaxID=301880 RepID=A0ABQ5DWR8_9ASTR
MDAGASSFNLRIMNQEFVKLDKFDGFDPNEVLELEKQRIIHTKDETLCCGHIKNSLSDRLYDFYAPITDPRKLWSALEFKYKQQEEGTNRYLIYKFFDFQMVDKKPILEQVHELQILVNKLNVLSIPIPEMLQVGAIVSKLPPSGNDISKKLIDKKDDYSLNDLLKHLRIEEEARNRDKRVNHGSTVHHVQVGNSSKRGSQNGQMKFNLGLRKSGNDDVNVVNGEIADRVTHVHLDDENFMA